MRFLIAAMKAAADAFAATRDILDQPFPAKAHVHDRDRYTVQLRVDLRWALSPPPIVLIAA